ncbi:MAG: TIGR02147 family protein [Fibrobacteria bacterium]|nr:TIGR02147 family protein [Fibrobacteria bacterium]
MESIYRYSDYRVYLREWFESEKPLRAALSYRWLGGKLGVDGAALVRVFRQERHLHEKHVPTLCQILKLGKRESEYFAILVLFCKARSPQEVRTHFERLMALRDIGARELEAEQYDYYRRWQNSALRALLSFQPFDGDWDALGHRLDPPLSAKEAQASVETMLLLGLLRKTEEGGFEPTDPVISSGDSWKTFAVRDFQLQTIDLAARSLLRHPRERRDISTLTLSLPADRLEELREMLREFRGRVLKWAAAQEPHDGVWQLNLQLFPLTREREPQEGRGENLQREAPADGTL